MSQDEKTDTPIIKKKIILTQAFGIMQEVRKCSN